MIPPSISNYLERQHAQYTVTSHPDAYTAQEEAAAAHVPGQEWAKAVVCFADDQPILAVVPAPFAVDLSRLQFALQARSIRLARESEFKGLYRDCETGAMPPLGPLYGQRVFVDKRLTEDSEVSFSAGSHHDAIRMAYREFERLAQPTVAEFSSGPSPSLWPRTATLPIDPICGAALDERHLAARSDFQGERYYFCSQRCKMEFDDNPYAYAKKQEG
jgi:Ala-tRNA(Pro) deacylase